MTKEGLGDILQAVIVLPLMLIVVGMVAKLMYYGFSFGWNLL